MNIAVPLPSAARMVPRTLLTAAFLLASIASAQTQYDTDYDGDVDADDWQFSAPPLPTNDDDEWAAYPGEAPPQQAPTQAQLEQQVAPYGTWYQDEELGRVWQPAQAEVGVDFVPYTTGGQWVATTAGWQFATTYRFGSAPFHYGRWHRSPRYGWVWWPQTQWAPAWVDWRCNSAGNVSWAPTAPAVRFRYAPAPSWSFAYGRYHRPQMQSFSWGRYGGFNGGWRGWHGGTRRYYRSHDYGGGGYRGGGGYYRGGGWGNRNGGGRGGGRRRW